MTSSLSSLHFWHLGLPDLREKRDPSELRAPSAPPASPESPDRSARPDLSVRSDPSGPSDFKGSRGLSVLLDQGALFRRWEASSRASFGASPSRSAVCFAHGGNGHHSYHRGWLGRAGFAVRLALQVLRGYLRWPVRPLKGSRRAERSRRRSREDPPTTPPAPFARAFSLRLWSAGRRLFGPGGRAASRSQPTSFCPFWGSSTRSASVTLFEIRTIRLALSTSASLHC